MLLSLHHSSSLSDCHAKFQLRISILLIYYPPHSVQCNCLLFFVFKSNLPPKDEDVWPLRKGHKNVRPSLPGIPNGELLKGHLCSFLCFYQKRFRTQRPVENCTVHCLPRFNKWQPLLMVASRHFERKSQVIAILEAPICIHPCPRSLHQRQSRHWRCCEPALPGYYTT